jgi:hypothetical protein
VHVAVAAEHLQRIDAVAKPFAVKNAFATGVSNDASFVAASRADASGSCAATSSQCAIQ